MNGSKKWSLGPFDLKEIVKVAFYSAASAVTAYLITQLPLIDQHIPSEYAALSVALVPMANTLLVAAKRFFQDRTQKLDGAG